MFEVTLLNNKTKEQFTKIFWSKKELDKFVNKVIRGKSLTLLGITNNQYLYD